MELFFETSWQLTHLFIFNSNPDKFFGNMPELIKFILKLLTNERF